MWNHGGCPLGRLPLINVIMKALMQMDNVEKGKLLADLFPDKLPEITAYITEQIGLFENNEVRLRGLWAETGFATVDFWYGNMREVQEAIGRYGEKLHRKSGLFADHLFDGYRAVFTVHCLIDYAGNDRCGYKLRQAIHLLFGERKFMEVELNK